MRIFASYSSGLTIKMRQYIACFAQGIDRHNRTVLELYGYATSKDSSRSSALLSLQRAIADQKRLKLNFTCHNDGGVLIDAVGEGRLSNSVLASFRNTTSSPTNLRSVSGGSHPEVIPTSSVTNRSTITRPRSRSGCTWSLRRADRSTDTMGTFWWQVGDRTRWFPCEPCRSDRGPRARSR